MSEEDTGFSDPLYVLLGALLSAVTISLLVSIVPQGKNARLTTGAVEPLHRLAPR